MTVISFIQRQIQCRPSLDLLSLLDMSSLCLTSYLSGNTGHFGGDTMDCFSTYTCSIQREKIRKLLELKNYYSGLESWLSSQVPLVLLQKTRGSTPSNQWQLTTNVIPVPVHSSDLLGPQVCVHTAYSHTCKQSTQTHKVIK